MLIAALPLLLVASALCIGAVRAQEGRRVQVVGSLDQPVPGREGTRWAIVIGVDRYQSAAVPPLHGAVADAKAIAAALVRYADFAPSQVVTLTTDGPEMPTSTAILDHFAALRRAVKPGDLLLVFFAGHGVEVEGRRFLLTHEAQIGSPGALKASSLPVSILMQEIESLPVSHRLIMVDACRDDPLNPGKATPNVATTLMESAFTLQPTSAGGVRATFLSCSPGESAYEWTEKGRGFFSYYVERGLAGEAAVYGKVTLNSLADYLNENVPQAVREERGRTQTPFSDVKGESFTLVRGEKLSVTTARFRSAPAETRTVYGVVKDAAGAPLVGTVVRVTWAQDGARGPGAATRSAEARVSTDEDGFFKTEVPALAVVSVSAEGSGFQAQSIEASPQESGRKLRLFLPRVEPMTETTQVAVRADVPDHVLALPPPPLRPTPGGPPTAVLMPTSKERIPALAQPAGAIAPLPLIPTPARQAQELARVGQQSFMVEEFENAERSAAAALAVDSTNTLARTVLANCEAVTGVNKRDASRLAAARELAHELIRLDATNGLAHNAAGLVAIGTGDLKSAEQEFATAITLDPSLAMAQANLGYVYLQLRQLKEAEKAYRAAIRVRPEGAVSYNGLAQVQLARGDAGNAVKAARAAISRYELRDVYLASFYVNLAVALHQNGDRAAAMEAVARARSLGLQDNPAYGPIEKAAKAGASKQH